MKKTSIQIKCRGTLSELIAGGLLAIPGYMKSPGGKASTLLNRT